MGINHIQTTCNLSTNLIYAVNYILFLLMSIYGVRR